MSDMQQTLVLIKPDAVARGLVGEFTTRFERRGLKLCSMKLCYATEDILKLHYEDLAHKPYFPLIVESMTLGPLVAQVWHGKNVVKVVRDMIGATDPQESQPGTIRGDYSMDTGRNVIHASDSQENALKEITLWTGCMGSVRRPGTPTNLIYRLS